MSGPSAEERKGVNPPQPSPCVTYCHHHAIMEYLFFLALLLIFSSYLPVISSSPICASNVVTALTTLANCNGPTGIDFNPLTGEVFAACNNDNSVVRIYQGSVVPLTTNCPAAYSVTHYNGSLFVACNRGHSLIIKNGVSSLLLSNATCIGPQDIVYDPLTAYWYIACSGGPVVRVTAPNVADIWASSTLCDNSHGVWYHKKTSTLYAACKLAGVVSIATPKKVNPVFTAGQCDRPLSVTVHSSNDKIYATCATSNTVVVRVGSATTAIVCTQAYFAVIDERTGIVYVSCFGQNTGNVIAIDPSSFAPTPILNSNQCLQPTHLALDTLNNLLYVACFGGTVISIKIIDTSSDVNNCNRCGQICSNAPVLATPRCINSTCDFECLPRAARNGSICVPLTSFPTNNLALGMSDPVFFPGQSIVDFPYSITPTGQLVSAAASFASLPNYYSFPNNSTVFTILSVQLLPFNYSWSSNLAQNSATMASDLNAAKFLVWRAALQLNSTVKLTLHVSIPAIVTFAERNSRAVTVIFAEATVTKLIKVPAAPVALAQAKFLPVAVGSDWRQWNLTVFGYADPAGSPLLYSFSYFPVIAPENKLGQQGGEVIISSSFSSVPWILAYFNPGDYNLVANIYTSQGALTTAYYDLVISAPQPPNGFDCVSLNTTMVRLAQALAFHDYSAVINALQLLVDLISFDSLLIPTDSGFSILPSDRNSFNFYCSTLISAQDKANFNAAVQLFALQTLNNVLQVATATNPAQIGQLINELGQNLDSSTQILAKMGAPDISKLLLDIIKGQLAQIGPSAGPTDPSIIGQNINSALSTLSSLRNCSLIPEITAILEKLVTFSNNLAVLGRDFTQFTTANGLTVLFKRVLLKSLLNSGVIVPSLSNSEGNSQFSFPLEALAALSALKNESSVDIVAIQHSPALNSCFGSATGSSLDGNSTGSSGLSAQNDGCTPGNGQSKAYNTKLLSNVYEILILTVQGAVVPVQNLSDPTVLGLPLLSSENLPNSLDLARVSCQFYDFATGLWQSSGCSVVTNAAGAISCACNHLTPFALLYYEEIQCDFTISKLVFLAFAILYALIFGAAAVQLIRLVAALRARGSGEEMKNFSLLYQHLLILLYALIRGISLLANYLPKESSFSANHWALIVNGIVSLLLPFCLFFLCFSLLAFGWISIYHFAMKNPQNAAGQLKLPLIVANFCVFSTLLVLLILIGVVDKADLAAQKRVVIAGTAILGFFTVALALSFAVYGYLLCEKLNSTRKTLSSSPSEPTNGSPLKQRVRKMFIISQVFSGCFVLVAVLQFVTAISLENFQRNMEMYTILSYSADLIATALILVLFEQGVRSFVELRQSSISSVSRTELSQAGKSSKMGKVADSQENSTRNSARNTLMPGKERFTGRNHQRQISNSNSYVNHNPPQNHFESGNQEVQLAEINPSYPDLNNNKYDQNPGNYYTTSNPSNDNNYPTNSANSQQFNQQYDNRQYTTQYSPAQYNHQSNGHYNHNSSADYNHYNGNNRNSQY
jgi:hypothetical protein